MSGCTVAVTAPNGWRTTPCGADTIAGGMCLPHLTAHREHTLMRQRIGTLPLTVRLTTTQDGTP